MFQPSHFHCPAKAIILIQEIKVKGNSFILIICSKNVTSNVLERYLDRCKKKNGRIYSVQSKQSVNVHY